jgi:hypothetical protein
VTALLADIRRRCPDALVLGYSAVTGAGLDELVDVWLGNSAAGSPLDIDYDRYARAEAALAWLNRTYSLASPDGCDTAEWARLVLGHLSDEARDQGWVVGHAKIGVDCPGGLTKLSLTAAGHDPTVDRTAGVASGTATAQVNVRMACEPAELEKTITAAVAAADVACGTSATAADSTAAFKPSYPRPVHRLAASDA